MMNRHAYLILAHEDVPLLTLLVNLLDDNRNDIYIHWDAKSGSTPQLNVNEARLFMLEERVRVSWAGYSMVEAEYLLFKKAYSNGPYAYYHLLSGADLPIKSQDYIHTTCERMSGTEFIAYSPASQAEIDFRVQHRFPFPEDFRTKNPIKRGIRLVSLKLQDITRFRRTDTIVKKGSQWCSLTQDFVAFLINQESIVRALFNKTFCPDEMFIQTVAFNSGFAKIVKPAGSEFDGNMRFIKWKNGELLPVSISDMPTIKSSDSWFARKFSSGDQFLINEVLKLSR